MLGLTNDYIWGYAASNGAEFYEKQRVSARQAVGIVSKFNFAPTENSKQNLIREGKPASSIFVTGNTAIDALKTTVRNEYTHPELEWANDGRLIMITAHRRENLGEPMKNMFRAIRRVMDENPDVKAVYDEYFGKPGSHKAHDILHTGYITRAKY